MPANGPIIVATSDIGFTVPSSAEAAIAALNGVDYSEQLAVAVIEALVLVAADASGTDLTIAVYRDAALTGTNIGTFSASPAAVAAGETVAVPVRLLDTMPPGSSMTYALTCTQGGAASSYDGLVRGFTVTTFPGGVVVNL